MAYLFVLAMSPVEASAQHLAQAPWLLEQSERFTTLKHRAPKKVETALLWTETAAEVPALEMVAWLRSGHAKLLVVSIIEIDGSPVWRVFSDSGKFVAMLAFDRRSRVCIGDLRNDGIVEVFGHGIDLGLVNESQRNAWMAFELDEGRTARPWREDLTRVIELRRDGARERKDGTTVRMAENALGGACAELAWKPQKE